MKRAKRHRRLPDQLCINCQRPVKAGWCNACGHLSQYAEMRTSFSQPKARPVDRLDKGALWVLPVREEEGDFE